MRRKSAKIKKKKAIKYKYKKVQHKSHTANGDFLLNPNESDRLSFSYQLSSSGRIFSIQNISYEIMINEKWEFVIRYDDHGGIGSLHRHDRRFLEDESEFPFLIPKNMVKSSSKKKQLRWAINDIKKNYLIYRGRFLKRCGIDLY